MPPRELIERTRLFALAVVWEEADECVDWLEYLRDGRIQHDPTLLQESQELAKTFAKSLKTSRFNSARMRGADKPGHSI